MSHIVTLRSNVTNLPALQAACRRLRLVPPEKQVTATLFDSRVEGYPVSLNGWSYPVMFNLGTAEKPETASVKFDNYGGRWGNIDRYHELLDTYNQENARQLLTEQGVEFTETVENGNVVFLTEGD